MYSFKTSNGKHLNNAEQGLLSDPVLDNQDEMVLESDNEESQLNTMLPQLWESTLTSCDDDRVVFDSDKEDFEEHYVLPFLETVTHFNSAYNATVSVDSPKITLESHLDNQDEMVLESDNEESQVNTMLPQLWESTLTGFGDDRVVFDSDEEDFEEHYVLPFLA